MNILDIQLKDYSKKIEAMTIDKFYLPPVEYYQKHILYIMTDYFEGIFYCNENDYYFYKEILKNSRIEKIKENIADYFLLFSLISLNIDIPPYLINKKIVKGDEKFIDIKGGQLNAMLYILDILEPYIKDFIYIQNENNGEELLPLISKKIKILNKNTNYLSAHNIIENNIPLEKINNHINSFNIEKSKFYSMFKYQYDIAFKKIEKYIKNNVYKDIKLISDEITYTKIVILHIEFNEQNKIKDINSFFYKLNQLSLILNTKLSVIFVTDFIDIELYKFLNLKDLDIKKIYYNIELTIICKRYLLINSMRKVSYSTFLSKVKKINPKYTNIDNNIFVNFYR